MLFVVAMQAGVSKLNEAKALVDELKSKAAEQSTLLRTKQAEADAALQEITVSMQVCCACMQWYEVGSIFLATRHVHCPAYLL